MGSCGVSSEDLPPLRPKRDFPDWWVFVVCYIGMGMLLAPVARYHYGPEATLKWVLMSALWPLEIVWWIWRVQQRL